MPPVEPVSSRRARARIERARAHRDETRTEAEQARYKISALETTMEDDPQTRPLLTSQVAKLRDRERDASARAKAAHDEYLSARSQYDTTPQGLADLAKALEEPTLSARDHSRLATRHALASQRHAEARQRLAQSSTSALRLFRRYEPDMWPQAADELAAARARENAVAWPPPRTGTPQRAAWDEQNAATTLSALLERGVPVRWARASCCLPEVHEALYEQAPYDGWDPLVAAHWASFPPVVTSSNAEWAMHAAAHTAHPVQVTWQQLESMVAADGTECEDEAGARWSVLVLRGPVAVMYPDQPPGQDRMLFREGAFGIGPDGALVSWPGFPDLRVLD